MVAVYKNTVARKHGGAIGTGAALRGFGKGYKKVNIMPIGKIIKEGAKLVKRGRKSKRGRPKNES